MLYASLADLVVIVHLAFVVFVGVGGLLVWRWPKLLWLHVPAVVWGVAIITLGFTCPLTPLEKYLRRLAGEDAYAGGFVDRYIEDVVYPDEFTPWLRGLAAGGVVIGYAGLAAKRRSPPRGRSGGRVKCGAAAPPWPSGRHR